MKILKLGILVKDDVSGTIGILTHFCLDMDLNPTYVYQPRGLNPKTKQPVDVIWISESRVSEGMEIEVDLPTHIIGTHAEDIATGFNGTIIAMTYHINGCIHVDIKPQGILEETGNTIDTCNFDIRRIIGEAIKPLDENKLQKSLTDTPSPAGMPEKNKS